jgi:hypothetical protein
MSSPSSKYCCWICGKSVSLESCKADEWGNAVHEECQVVRIALRRQQRPESLPKKVSGQK